MKAAGLNLRRIPFSRVCPTTPPAGHCPGGIWEGTDLETTVEFNCIRIYSSFVIFAGEGGETTVPLDPPYPPTPTRTLQAAAPKGRGPEERAPGA